MSDSVDFCEVQDMIRDARSEIRGEIDTAVREAVRLVRADLADEIASLRRIMDARTESAA